MRFTMVLKGTHLMLQVVEAVSVHQTNPVPLENAKTAAVLLEKIVLGSSIAEAIEATLAHEAVSEEEKALVKVCTSQPPKHVSHISHISFTDQHIATFNIWPYHLRNGRLRWMRLAKAWPMSLEHLAGAARCLGRIRSVAQQNGMHALPTVMMKVYAPFNTDPAGPGLAYSYGSAALRVYVERG